MSQHMRQRQQAVWVESFIVELKVAARAIRVKWVGRVP
jgi:hypothetical protein